MKIGIVTLFCDNYNMGGLLQAFALQRKCSQLGAEAELLLFDYLQYYNNTIKQTNKLKKYLQIKKRNIKKPMFRKRMNNFYLFMYNIKNSCQFYLSVQNLSYDSFIVGSDQVWGEWLPMPALKQFLLMNEELSGKRFSYAASLGGNTISEKNRDLYRECLNKFDAISVREVSAQTELRKILPEKEIYVHIDPTLLLTAKEWSEVKKEAKSKPSKYIFCYFLGQDKSYRDSATKLSQNLKLPIITLPYIKDQIVAEYDNNFGDIRDFSSGPAEFLDLIMNAELVVTDSFHATVFSLQFHTPFFALDRYIDGVSTTNCRITDLLQTFGLLDRYINVKMLEEIQEVSKVNFDVFEEKIIDLRRDAEKYLSSIIYK